MAAPGDGGGIGLYFTLPEEPAWGFAVMAAGLALSAGTLARAANRAVFRIALALLTAASLGFGVVKLRTELVRAPVLARKLGPAGIDGRVEFVQTHGKSNRVTLGAVALRRLPPDCTPALVRVSVRSGAEALMPGQWVHLTAVLMPPPGPATPGGYDFGLAAFYDRIGAVGYAYGRPRPIAPPRADSWSEDVRLVVAKLR